MLFKSASVTSRPDSFIASATIAAVSFFALASCIRAHRIPGASVPPRPTLVKYARKRLLVSFRFVMRHSMGQKGASDERNADRRRSRGGVRWHRPRATGLQSGPDQDDENRW